MNLTMQQALEEIAAGNLDGESLEQFAARAQRVAKSALPDRFKGREFQAHYRWGLIDIYTEQSTKQGFETHKGTAAFLEYHKADFAQCLSKLSK